MEALRFEPYVRTALWGTEEWLVSAHPSAPGRIQGGGGRTLRDVCPGFPLLIKRIVAEKRLSVQVHPNETTARTVGGEAKTEMWCVLRPGPIFAGFRSGVTRADIERAVDDGSFETLLVRFDAKVGECYFIPGGLVHAIGEGTSVYEVQQSSDTTFRLYDWGRVGADGRPRPLQVAEGLSAMDLSLPPPQPSEGVRCHCFSFERKSSAELAPSALWRAIYLPGSGESLLLPPGETFATDSEAWVTDVPSRAFPMQWQQEHHHVQKGRNRD